LAPKWSPRGIYQRLRKTIKMPADVPLALRIGYFIWRVPSELEITHLSGMLDQFRQANRPHAYDPDSGVKRLMRLSEPWLRRGFFRARNTCYLRAMILYRYLDPGEMDMSIHYVVEPPRNTGDRLHGHAWVTVSDEVLDVEDFSIVDRSSEIFRHPPALSVSSTKTE
jgi:hypothetical protein